MSRSVLALAANLALAAASLTSSSLKSYVNSLALTSNFNPIEPAYWTGLPHHRRTPFAVSPDGKTAWLAYLDGSGTGVHVQGVNPTTFKAVGDPITVAVGKEAGGLVAHNDGFALLTNEITSDSDLAIASLYRYTDGTQTFRTLLGGNGIDDSVGHLASPDINGDLVYSEKAGYYAAYIVVTAYDGDASGHYGDAIRYITPAGDLETISGASSSWGCSHNTGIAFEEADAPPFASLCAEDQGEIWLNTQTQGMSNNGVKVSNEHTINGASNEPMGGMSGSYSALARFTDSDAYIFSWVSRGAIDLYENTWLGDGYTSCQNRTNPRNVAIALFSDKNTLVGDQATSVVGATDGDSQVNWMTQGSNDCSNAHAAVFDSTQALITWEEISNPECLFDAMGCQGTFAGTSFQMVNSAGDKVGDVVKSEDVYVAGDMVTMADGRICWPYVDMTWDLSGPIDGSNVTSISFACMSSGSSASSGTTSSTAAAAATKSQAVTSKTTSAAAVKATTSAADIQSSVAAVVETVEASSVPSDAPQPSLIAISSVSIASNIVSAGVTSDVSAIVSPSAAASTSVVGIETSAAAVTSDAVPAATSAAVHSFTVTPFISSATPVETSAAAGVQASSSAPVSAQLPAASTGFQTRTRKHTRRPRPTGRPHGSGDKKPCPAKFTETATVYVTAH